MQPLYSHKMTKACKWDERRMERSINEEKDRQEDGGDHGGGRAREREGGLSR